MGDFDNKFVSGNSLTYLANKTKEYVDDNKFSGDYNDLDNKPCYFVEEETELLNRTDFYSGATGSAISFEPPMPIIPGQLYTVICDGVEYEYVAYAGDYGTNIIAESGSSYLNYTGPFIIYSDPDITTIAMPEAGKDHTVVVTAVLKQYTTLDNNYIDGYVIKKGAGTYGEAFNNSHAECALGDYSHSEGYTAKNPLTAIPDLSTDSLNDDIVDAWALNRFALAKGHASHAEGYNTLALGDVSHAEGEETMAGGDTSHAEGFMSVASGNSSHAEGSLTAARGFASHTEGCDTIATGDYQHVQGKFNIEDTEKKYAHIVGNGDRDNARSNAHTLDWNGNAWYAGQVMGTNLPYTTTEDVEQVYIEGTYDFTDSNRVTLDMTQHMVIGDKYTVVIDGTRYENVICYDDSYSYGFEKIGNSDGTYSDYPFSISLTVWSDYYLDIYVADSLKGSTHDIAVYHVAPQDVQLDSKYIKNKPGLFIEKSNSEIFNDYVNNVSTGQYSHAEGTETIASGNYSHAEGEETTAYGWSSHAEGARVTAYGNYSHAEGTSNWRALEKINDIENASIDDVYNAWQSYRFSLAYGNFSHIEGHSSLTLGENSHAEGTNCVAFGGQSHAEGCETISKGIRSHTEGLFTIANGQNQHVQGKYNIEDTADTYAHIVGNGTADDARSNAHTLDWSGNAWYAGNVSVDGTPTNDNDLTTKAYVDNAITANTLLDEDELDAAIADIFN